MMSIELTISKLIFAVSNCMNSRGVLTELRGLQVILVLQPPNKKQT